MKRYESIRLKVSEPKGMVFNGRATSVVAESDRGSFCIRPNHIDLSASLIPGVIVVSDGSEEQFIATDRAIMVKCGDQLTVSTPFALVGNDLEHLHQKLNAYFTYLGGEEKETDLALLKLEAELIRQFRELTE